MPNAPESVVLAAQKHIYELKDALAEQEAYVQRKLKEYEDAKSALRYGIKCIKEHAKFLDKESPINDCTWLEQIGCENI